MASQSVPNHPLPFAVCGTGLATYPWQIVASKNLLTVSLHKSLKTAIRIAELLNLTRMVMPEPVYAERETYQARDVRKSCQLWFDTSWAPADSRQCDGVGTVTDLETGKTHCLKCWVVNHA